ncbi:MAG: efflux RND transporter periplasmic adaptor subunit [Sedimentisphaerales bacterium]|jgi:HlyD family secretion protein
MNQKLQKIVYSITAGRRKWFAAAGLVILLALLVITLASSKTTAPSPAKILGTFKARRDNLTITVTESGSIKARNSISIKSEVEGQATIISIIPEGNYITPEDVNNKILVELDSSNLAENLAQRKIEFATAESGFAEANEAFAIQLKQNESDISAAQLKVKFALMDFQKYLGETLANRLIGKIDEVNDPDADIATLIDIDGLLNDANNLGGEASQKLGELRDNILLAEEELKKAQNTLDWTIRLREKEYVSETDLQTDKLSVEGLEIKFGQAKTVLDLFKSYDFSKQTQKLLSDYCEAKRDLERTYAKARSQLAQAKARLESAKATFDLQQERLNKTQKQLAACTIKAPAPGLVVYRSSSDYWYSERPIEVGATIQQREEIMSLPDTSEMTVEISVHESSITKVQPGQLAKITIDAFPDKTFTGKVLKIAPLPDQRRSWLSPDLKVYTTQVSIDGSYDFLKPGMSAKVEITVEQLDNVIIVPVQVVANRGGKKVCYCITERGTKEREVKTGSFNDTFVQIVEGLQPGEEVLMNPPRIIEPTIADANVSQRPQKQVTDKKQQEDRPAAATDVNAHQKPQQDNRETKSDSQR